MNTSPIKVLLADDEVIIRRGLISTVQWNKYNMQVVADVPNGKKGWDAFLEHRPDVIITDIVMPEMNGIELAQKVKEHTPNTKILLLSCHRDFEYAQQGIRLGASGYLLKTSFDDNELEQYLELFKKDLRRDAPAIEPYMPMSETHGLFVEWLYGVNQYFLGKMDVLLGASWAWMNEANYAYLITGGSNTDLQQIRSDIQDLLRTTSEADMMPIQGDVLLLMCSSASCRDWNYRLSKWKGTYPDLQWTKSSSITGKQQWIEAVKRLHGQYDLEKKYNINRCDWPEPIVQAVQIMIRHVDTQLSVSDVAQQVGLSRSHFSTLFKKVVGESFVSFMYQIKLNIVCELLTSSKLNIQDISDKVGMPDVKYFSKWFKRCTFETPSQYRSKHRIS
ncbi:response regulator [Paenibacillus sp. N1-5-1-14]|uniref:response regulator transcription factor n=1 Tax=Paenibacillus radicibacter TaxID=2972488 RepID=UPI0021596A03|nr:response regulator [Paenibacillus radicibacter]MCR8642505.1 response regulator [Paenibacillus radicibacter]